METEKLDNKTLALLMVIADLLEKKSDARHILTLYARKLEGAKEYQSS